MIKILIDNHFHGYINSPENSVIHITSDNLKRLKDYRKSGSLFRKTDWKCSWCKRKVGELYLIQNNSLRGNWICRKCVKSLPEEVREIVIDKFDFNFEIDRLWERGKIPFWYLLKMKLEV